MVAKPTPAESAPPLAQAGVAAPAEQVSMDTDLPPVEGIAGDMPTTLVPVEAAAKDAAIAPDPTDTAIAATRHTLESIDQMLGVSPK
jgi:chemotaxis protein MotC